MTGIRIEHVAVWARDEEALERLRGFYARWFDGRAGERYASERHPGFVSYFVTFPGGGARMELMTAPWLSHPAEDDAVGWGHVAMSVGSRAAVDALAARMAADGVPLVLPPRETGDGYYEAVVRDPDGNLVEITE
jgi:lactoylglutathione lyase